MMRVTLAMLAAAAMAGGTLQEPLQDPQAECWSRLRENS